MPIAVYGKTDLGQVRSVNEDSLAWWIPEREDEALRRGVLLVVADGMGGGKAGDRASQLAVSSIIGNYSGTHVSGTQALDPERLLVQAVETANAAIYEEARSDTELSGMGTTCTALIVLGHDLLVAQVGDSRAYLLHESGLIRLTRDHSLVHELLEQGRITEQEARTHPRRNVVTRALGVGPTVDVEAKRWPSLFRPGSTLLLCSDGLHGVLEDSEIRGLVDGADLPRAAQALVDAANERGGPDNITVLMARLHDGRLTTEDQAGTGRRT